MTAAERWTGEHGFAFPGDFRNGRGEHLDDLLPAEPTVQLDGVTVARWRFQDGSSIVARCGLWEIEIDGMHF